MNRIFRVIWNQSTQTWTAVSEFSKGKSKSSSQNVKTLSFYIASILGGVISSSATAEAGNVVVNRGSSSIYVGGSGIANGSVKDQKTIIIGNNAKTSHGQNIAIGMNAVAGAVTGEAGQNAMAIGMGARAERSESLAIGSSAATVDGKAVESTAAIGDQSMAIGANTKAIGNSSIAIGNDDTDVVSEAKIRQNITIEGNTYRANSTTVGKIYENLTGDKMAMKVKSYMPTKSGEGSVAIGVKALAMGEISISLGTGSNASGLASSALGTGATANKHNSVAIGAASNTHKSGTRQLDTTINGIAYKWAGGSKTEIGDIVSFGAEGFERQLKNVAAGEISSASTDAINGSQLYAVADRLSRTTDLIPQEKGSVNITTNPEYFVNGTTVAKAINGSGWNIRGNGANATGGSSESLVKPSETVDFRNGNGTIAKLESKDGKTYNVSFDVAYDNTTIVLENGKLKAIAPKSTQTTVSSTNKSVMVTNTTNGDVQNFDLAINVDNSTITIDKDGKLVANIPANTTLNVTDGKISKPTEGDKLVNASTVADAINSTGWGLQVNGKLASTVKPSDKVNFVNGQGTTVVVENKDGVNGIKVNSPLAYINDNVDDKSTPSNQVSLVGQDSHPVGLGNLESGLGQDKPADDKAFLSALEKAEGKTLNNAVNVSDLKQASKGAEDAALTKAGFNLTTKAVGGNVIDKAKDKHIATNDVFTLDAGKNIVVKQIDNGYEIATADDITLGKAGQDGVDGKLSVNGKDGSSVVLNGKDGSIGLMSPKGEDGKDGASANISVAEGKAGLDGKDGETKTRIVYETKDKDGNPVKEEVATLNDGLKFKGDNGESINKPLNSQLEIIGGADKNNLSDKNIGINVNEEGQIEVKLAKDIDLNQDGSIAVGDTVLNDNGLTITGGPSITKNSIDAGNNKITNVADGNISPNSKDAVNGRQLYNLQNNISTEIKNTGWTLQGNSQEISRVKPNDKVNFVNGQGTTVIVENKDGVNTIKVNSPLVYVNENADDKSTPSNQVSLVGKDNNPVGLGNIESGLGKDKPEDSKVFLDVLGKADGDTLNNAVNIGDLKQAAKGAENAALSKAGFNLTTKAAGGNVIDTAKDKRIATDDVFTLDAGKNVVVRQIDNGYEIATADDITLGKDGKDGVDGKLSVNGKYGSSVILNGKEGAIGLTSQKGTDGKDGASANISVAEGKAGLGGKDGETKTRIVYETKDKDGKLAKEEIATLNDGLKFKGDNGEVINKPLNSQLEIIGGADKDNLSDKNIGINANKKGQLEVKLAKDIDLTQDGSVTIGNTTLNDNGLTITGGPSITTYHGINAGNKVISNVAEGKAPTDAVNVNQLAGVANNLNNRINKVDKDLRGGIAGALASAELYHATLPGKSMVAIGAGTYHGQNAVAVGYSRLSDNGKIGIKFSANTNSRGNTGAAASIGYQW